MATSDRQIIVDMNEGDTLEDALDALYDELGSPRPAQDKLHRDQRAAIAEFVDDGFRDRREFLEWLHGLLFLSLGRLHGNWLARVARDPVVLSCVITDEGRRRSWRPEPVSLEDAKRTRRLLAKKYIRPACRAAFREIRHDAQEYIQEGNRVDLRNVTMFAMRPGVQTLKDRQEAALRLFLDGFGDEDELDAWLHRLDDVTYGEMDRVEGDLDWRVEMESVAKRVLLDDGANAARTRENLAAYLVLPAMNLAVPVAMVRAQELREEKQKKQMKPTQL